MVYFVRTVTNAWNANFSYFDSIRFIGKSKGLNYFRYECIPGRHLFWCRAENRDYIEANLEAGKLYFIEVKLKIGLAAAIQLQPVTPTDTVALDKILAVMRSKRPEMFLDAQLQVDPELKQVIAREMEIYKERKKLGQVILKLETPVN